MNNWILTKQQNEIMEALMNGEDVSELIEKHEQNKIMYIVDLANALEMLEYLYAGIAEKQKEVAEKKAKISEQIERAKKIMVHAIKTYGQDNEIIYNGIKFGVKKNPPKLNVFDENAVPEEYKTVTVKIKHSDLSTLDFNGVEYTVKSVDVDKDSIKKLNKAGIGVAGTEVVQEESLKR